MGVDQGLGEIGGFGDQGVEGCDAMEDGGGAGMEEDDGVTGAEVVVDKPLEAKADSSERSMARSILIGKVDNDANAELGIGREGRRI
ncbi:hypothetical protein Vadar_018869 [Vaccinium darrowii]|uniref:Uncharacterized protein n=1 Tax=Vaccinium darrowii TaxID=229202 RepID=A0ACB7XBE0_9ERIC|nr:hypothetical protein Vadar_018869 [Vaccinium darrowii]